MKPAYDKRNFKAVTAKYNINPVAYGTPNLFNKGKQYPVLDILPHSILIKGEDNNLHEFSVLSLESNFWETYFTKVLEDTGYKYVDGTPIMEHDVIGEAGGYVCWDEQEGDYRVSFKHSLEGERAFLLLKNIDKQHHKVTGFSLATCDEIKDFPFCFPQYVYRNGIDGITDYKVKTFTPAVVEPYSRRRQDTLPR